MSSNRLKGIGRQQLNHSRNLMFRAQAIGDSLYYSEQVKNKRITTRQKKFIANLKYVIEENNLELPEVKYNPYECREYASQYINFLNGYLEDNNVEGYHRRSSEEETQIILNYKEANKIDDCNLRKKEEFNNYIDLLNRPKSTSKLIKRRAVAVNG